MNRVPITIFGHYDHQDKLEIIVDAETWTYIRMTYLRRFEEGLGATLEFLDTDGDEWYIDLHNIATILRFNTEPRWAKERFAERPHAR